MTLKMRGLVLAMAMTATACSGGGGGGGGSSSTAKGTGYLKLDLPAMTGSVVSSSTFRPMMSVNTYPVGQYVFGLKTLLTNTNNGTDCSGVVESIPFLVCMVESVGINKPGTYTGAMNGVTLSAVATELTSDPDGYTLEAIVTKDGTQIFSYKANADGKKGEIKYIISGFYQIMGVSQDPQIEAERTNWIKWDSTVSTDAVVETAEEWHEDFSSGTTILKVVRYMKAFIDEDAGIADIVSKQSSKTVRNAFSPAEQQISTEIFQSRVKDDAFVEGYTRCSEVSTSTAINLGSRCWDFSTNTSGGNPTTHIDWEVYSYADVNRNPPLSPYNGDLVGGTWSSSGYSHLAALTLSGSFGSKAVPGGKFGNATLDTLLDAQRAGAHAFSFQMDHTQSSPATGSVEKLAQDVMTKSFSALDALVPGK